MSKTVYILRNQALGDVIWVEPIIRHYLNEGCKVVLVSRYAGIYAHVQGFRGITQLSLVWKLKLKWVKIFKPGSVVDLNNSYEQDPQQHMVEAYAKKANISGQVLVPNSSSFNDAEVKTDFNLGKTIFFHIQAPSQKLSYRNVHGVDWKRLANELENDGYTCVELLPEHADYAPVLTAHYTHSLSELFGLMKKANYFIGLDSGPAQVAQLYGVTSFLFFGSVNPAFRLNLTNFKGHIFQKTCDRSGCYHLTRGYHGTPCVYETPTSTPPCCTFTTEEVVRQILQLLNIK